MMNKPQLSCQSAADPDFNNVNVIKLVKIEGYSQKLSTLCAYTAHILIYEKTQDSV